MHTTPLREVEELKKSCKDCHTTTTPLWRGGPAGPRTLCNACGIKYRKRRKAILGLESVEKGKKKSRSSKSNKLGIPLKLRLMALGKEMVLQRSSSTGYYEEQMNKLGEEEQAAMLLMALSCGAFYA